MPAQYKIAAAVALGIVALTSASAAERLGLCPGGAPRSDAYVQLLCEGEAQLVAGRNGEALEKFRIAATVGRLDASNELAWAGLASAHCRRGELKQGREWAAYFAQARRLWLGDLHCSEPGAGKHGELLPYVESRMCIEALQPDYELIRAKPLSAIALDLSARLKIVSERVERDCAAVGADVDARPAAAESPPPKRAAKKKRARGRTSASR